MTSNEEGFPLLTISGFLGMGDSRAASNLDYSRTFMFADNVTLTKGKHTAVAYARTAEHATAVAWSFRVR